MQAITDIRAAVVAAVTTAQPELVTVEDGWPASLDAENDLPAAGVWFEDGAPGEEWLDEPLESAPLVICLYVTTANHDSELERLASPIKAALTSFTHPAGALDYAGHSYDRDAESPWRTLRLNYLCSY